MATKLTADQSKRIGNIGLIAKTGTVEEAAKKLIEFLAKNDVAGVDGDPINDLIEMAEVFYEPDIENAEEISDLNETEDLDDLAEEVATQPIIAKKGVAATAKPGAVKPTAAKTAAAKVKSVATDGEKFDARNNPAHDALLQPFRDYFPPEDFQIDILKQGFTVRVLGKNAKTTLLNFDELKIGAKKELSGNLYTNRFKTPEDLLPFLPDIYHDREMGMFRAESHPSLRKITETELFDIFENSDFITESLNRASGKDAVMGANREKLEAVLNNTTAPAKKKISPLAPVIEDAELDEQLEEMVEEELMEEEAAPVVVKRAPFSVKKAAVPVVATKKAAPVVKKKAVPAS